MMFLNGLKTTFASKFPIEVMLKDDEGQSSNYTVDLEIYYERKPEEIKVANATELLAYKYIKLFDSDEDIMIYSNEFSKYFSF